MKEPLNYLHCPFQFNIAATQEFAESQGEKGLLVTDGSETETDTELFKGVWAMWLHVILPLPSLVSLPVCQGSPHGALLHCQEEGLTELIFEIIILIYSLQLIRQ